MYFILSCSAFAAGFDWSDAVTELTAERSKAVQCAIILKDKGDSAAVAMGGDLYNAAKSEMDKAVDGLIAALGEEARSPASLEKLQDHLRQGIESRLGFCAKVEPLYERDPGERNIWADIMTNTIEPALRALSGLFTNESPDKLQVMTIQTQLEAAKWPEYSVIGAKN